MKNIKKIIREEIEDFDWIKNTIPQPWEEFMFPYTELEGKLENTRFGEQIVYRDPKGEWIFYHGQNPKNGYVRFNYNKIWKVFESIFGFSYEEIQELLRGWLGEHYNLRGVTARTKYITLWRGLGEHYNLRGVTANSLGGKYITALGEHYNLREGDEDELDWIRNISGELPEINDQNKYLALVDLLGVDEVFGDIIDFEDHSESDFEENGWEHYGIDTFTLNNGEVWGVGTEKEFDDALEEYWKSYVDDVGYDGIRDISDYITMSDTDRHMWASSEADYYVGDLSDTELLEIANLEDEYNELEEEMETLDSELYDADDEDEEERIKGEIKELERKKIDLIESAKEVVNEITYNEWYDCLSDPYECLVKEKGWYSNADDLLSNTSFHIDEDRLIREWVNNSNWGTIGNYDGNYYMIGDYVLIRIE